MTEREAKAVLRVAALDRRNAVTAALHSAFAERLALEGVALARTALVHTVAAYSAVRDEADTSLLLQALAYHEFQVALPCTVERGMPLLFRRWTPRDRLVEGPFGTREPSPRCPEVIPDLLFVPLAAFDCHGGRIGYGGGFYDRTIRQLRRTKPALAIGIAFATQEVDEVPMEDHDVRLDYVLTDTDFITCGAA